MTRFEQPLLRVALSGGPGGGKTTALKRLSRLTQICGRRLFLVNETASLLKSGSGFGASRFRSGSLEFQRQVINRQFAVEAEVLHHVDVSRTPAIVLFDRGMFDSIGYIQEDDYAQLLKEMSLSNVDVLSRYDKIIFLRSAAAQGIVFGERFSIPTPELFRCHANSVEKAILQHLTGHPEVEFVPTQPTFEGRFEIVFRLLEQYAM